MSEFVDRLLVQLSDSPRLLELVVPPSDAGHSRVRALLDAAYDLAFATIHEVRDVRVVAKELQWPLFAPVRMSGTWTQTIPNYGRTDVAYERSGELPPVWVDMSAHLEVVLVMDLDMAQVESILTRSIDDFNTLDEFRSRFRFIDLNAFMAKHGLTTVEELKAAYAYLLTEVRLHAPGPFDPANPANQYRYSLNVAILIRDVLDVAAALRDAKFARGAIERGLVYRREVGVTEVRTPYAPIVIFPQATLTGTPFGAGALQALFSAERVLAVFMTPA
jgi:hypothetical protein